LVAFDRDRSGNESKKNGSRSSRFRWPARGGKPDRYFFAGAGAAVFVIVAAAPFAAGAAAGAAAAICGVTVLPLAFCSAM